MDQNTHQIIDETVGHVDAFWGEHRVPMLLSALGNVADGRISQEAKRHGKSLREFLEAVVGQERVLVVEHPENLTIVGVVPSNEETKVIRNWGPYFDKAGTKSTLPRLHPALWAAFRKPIEDATDRYVQGVQGGDSVWFTDVAHGDRNPGGVQVDRRFIAGLENSPEKVYENAAAWLRENNLDISNFQTKTRSGASTRLPSNDLLGKLILALDSRDLQKISIPMEVVAKLRRQSV